MRASSASCGDRARWARSALRRMIEGLQRKGDEDRRHSRAHGRAGWRRAPRFIAVAAHGTRRRAQKKVLCDSGSCAATTSGRGGGDSSATEASEAARSRHQASRRGGAKNVGTHWPALLRLSIASRRQSVESPPGSISGRCLKQAAESVCTALPQTGSACNVLFDKKSTEDVPMA